MQRHERGCQNERRKPAKPNAGGRAPSPATVFGAHAGSLPFGYDAALNVGRRERAGYLSQSFCQVHYGKQHNLHADDDALQRTAIGLHWLIALLIVCGFWLGWIMTDIPGFTPTKLKYFSWHKWIGVTVFALAVVRVLWRATHRAPADAATHARPGKRARRISRISCSTC